MSARLRCALALLCLLAWAGLAQAQPRASLDRDSVALGESVVLRIQSDSLERSPPDLSPLEDAFEVLQRSGRTEFVNGRSTSVWEFTLEPRAVGVLGIPSLSWAGGRTEPLSLRVLPSRPGSALEGDPVFLEVEVDDTTPYVQQAVVYTLRLGYRVTLMDGRLDAPDVRGATLRQAGDDLSFQREVGGHRYRIVERRYVLVADRSGPLEIGPARFRGRYQAGGSVFGAFESITEASRPLTLEVRPRPHSASLPWIPARELAITLQPPPVRARLGEPLTLTLELHARGVTRAQLGEVGLPESPDYQVYPEAAEFSERLEDGVPVVEGVRRFVVVPLRGDRLLVPPSSLAWWDLERDRPAQSAIPGIDIELEAVAAGSSGAPGGDAAGVDGSGWVPAAPGPAGRVPWSAVALCLAIGWALTLAWHMYTVRGRERGRGLEQPVHATGDVRDRRAAARSLRRMLEEGDLAGIGEALVRLAPEPVDGLSGVLAWLADPDQREAVALLQAARWGRGDPQAAREQLRRAFRAPPRWRASASCAQRDAAGAEPLPPLYPNREA